MCEYCKNVDAGNDIEDLVNVSVDFGDLDSGVVYAQLERNDDDEPCLVAGIFFEGTGIAIQNYRKIHFCPMCGRKLE